MDKIAEEHGGFRKERGCEDQSYTVGTDRFKEIGEARRTLISVSLT
jgi:hypothetical protein